MNDATELESSFDGAIDFFQNLRRGLRALEAGASIQNDRLRAIAASVDTLQQGWQADHRALTTLVSDTHIQAGQLAELRTDGQRLDAQLGIIESLVANFQQDQQQLQQNLTALSADLQAQQVTEEQHSAALTRIETLEQQITGQTRDLHSLLISIQALSHDSRTSRDHLKALESRLGQHEGQLGQLEQVVKADQERLDQFSTGAQSQNQDLRRIEQVLDTLGQTTATTTGAIQEHLEEQQSRFDDLTGSLATVWQDVQTLQESVGEQLAEQQIRFDDLTGSLATIWQDAQTLQQDFTQLSGEFETQRPLLADAIQSRQDLQKQQDRIRHLETLVNKVSADTNSTRQILNVLQTDLTNQSDLLRELDQNWHDALTREQNGGQPAETPVTGSSAIVKLEQISALADDLTASRQQHENIRQEVTTVQEKLTEQNERLVNVGGRLEELQQSLQQQLQSQQEQLNQLEAALADLQNAPAPEANTAADLTAMQEMLASSQTQSLNELQQLLQQQLQSQQEQLNQLEAALADLQNAPAPEANTAADLTAMQEMLASSQTQSLNELQQLLQQQLQSQQEQLNQLEAALADLQNAPAPEANTAADLTAMQETLASSQTQSLNELQQLLQQQLQSQQEQLNQLEAALADLQNAPAPEANTAADLTAMQETLASSQTQSLNELQQLLQQQLQSQQEQLNQLEAALADLQNAPAPEANTSVDVAEVHETLVIQTSAISDLREVTQRRFGILENRQLDLQHTVESLAEWHQAIEDVRQQLAQLDSAMTQQPRAAKTDDVPESESRHELNMLQQSLIELEARVAGQTQAFSGNFEQFRALRTEIQNLQHNVTALDALPAQLHSFGQIVNAQDRQVSQIKEAVEYLQQDLQQRDDANPTDSNASFEELTAQIDQRREQMEQLTATLETMQSESRLTQEKVITMATNVAKRIFELQNQLTASETVQSERLQDAEQKIIQLQAAIEMLQTPTKSRRWFKMPATLATVALTVGAAFLGILAQVIWTTG